MAIDLLVNIPQTSDPVNFAARADNLLGVQLNTFITQTNTAATAMNLNSVSDTSVTSNVIGTGAKTFVVSASKSFLAGMYLIIADTAAGSTNSMFVQVTSYSGTSLVVNCISFLGTGTKTAWTISLSSAGGAALTTNTFSGSQNFAPPVSIASAATVAIGAAASNSVTITGTTTITAFDTLAAGSIRFVKFSGSLTLTYNATSMILPKAANIITAGDDEAIFMSLGGANWKCIAYERFDGENSRIQIVGGTVATSALTLTLNSTLLDMRSSTLSSGNVATRSAPNTISLVVPSTATLGTTNAVQSRLIMLALDNAGTVELAVINAAGGVTLDEVGVISTIAISAAATSASVIYSTTARTGVAYRIVGFVESTQATAGTWATAPSLIQGAGGDALKQINKVLATAAQTTVAGTSKDFLSIPNWVKIIYVNFNNVSTTGVSPYLIQLGTAGVPTTTGYAGSVANITAAATSAGLSATTGFELTSVNVAASLCSGQAIFTRVSELTWAMSSNIAGSSGRFLNLSAGAVTLAGLLDNVRVTSTGGTETFDNGSISLTLV